MSKRAPVDRYLDDHLPGLIDAIEVRPDQLSIRTALHSFATAAGFEYFTYLSVRGGHLSGLSNYHEEWRQQYVSSNYLAIDPVIAQAKRTMRPTSWSINDRLRVDMNARKVLDEAAEFGIVAGMALPIHGSFGRTAILALASSDIAAGAIGVKDVAYSATAVTVLDVNVQRLAQSTELAASIPLSPRELTCLMWASFGKTYAETASMLGITEKTVRFYLERARSKLGASNTTHAVRLATEHGLL